MTRVIFINRFYWPDEPATAQLLTDLAEALATHGFNVAVITSQPPESGAPVVERRNGVEIHRVRALRASRRTLLGRVAEIVSFYPGALWRLFRETKRGDTVIALTDPPLLGAAAWPITRLRGASLMHWVQDIYPEIAVELTGHRWLTVFRPLRNLAWRRANACLVPSADMAQTVLAAGVPSANVVVFPNWAPEGLAPPPPAAIEELRAQWSVTGKFVVGYSGNLGRVHDLEPILELATVLQHEPDFVFLLIGGGARKTALEQSARDRGLKNVRFLSPQPRETLAVSLGAADVHLVTLKPGAEHYVFPSKLSGVTRVGRPVIVIGAPDCELAQLVRAGGYGAAFTRTEIGPMAAMLRKLRADEVYRNQLGAAAIVAGRPGLGEAADTCTKLLEAGLRGGPATASESRTR
jgi:glycosyltransferase involved in cell wall biosynthesis